MTFFITNITKVIFIIFISLTNLVLAQSTTGKLAGTVTDEAGFLIKGATVLINNQTNSFTKTTVTDENGNFEFNSIAPGQYVITAVSDGFAKYHSKKILVQNRRTILHIELKVTEIREEVLVKNSSDLSNAPEQNLSATVLKEKEIESLPDDPESLSQVLRALAGPSTGQIGAQIYVDGFSAGELPPKDTIREIRINQNPFSAEFENLGHGRIQIFTRPGSNRFYAEGTFRFSDESLNSRNPFAERRVPSQNKNTSINSGGALIEKKLSYSGHIHFTKNNENKVIQATSLDSELNPFALNNVFRTPRKNMHYFVRLDYLINKNHTLVANYSRSRDRNKNQGVGELTLQSRAFNSNSTNQTLRLTETAIINESVVNETRFQYRKSKRTQAGENNTPSINVFGAFNGGGSPIGEASNSRDSWELTNISTWAWNNHSLRAGGRIRAAHLNNISHLNFNGTYSFSGGIAPLLDANNNISLDSSGQAILTPITSIERYRRTLLFQKLGIPSKEIRLRGGGATQFSIASGNPQTDVSQIDFGGFIQDDWRVTPDFMIGLGLRYEAQTNISNNINLAPRVSFAWSPKFGSKDSKTSTVIRGGFGIFFSRISENLTFQANRFNGINQRRFIVDDTAILDSFPSVPSTDSLSALPQTRRIIASNIRSPYTMQGSISLERRLPMNINFVATFINTKTLHSLRSRNINAPISGITGGIRPFGVGNIYQYESSGIFKQKQLTIRVRRRIKRLFLSTNYTLGKAESDTDGALNFPVNQFNMRNEFGRSSIDIRHRFTFNGLLTMPWNMSLNTFIIASSGVPFNITTGQDTNGDSLFNDRPSFATDLTRDSVVRTDFGALDLAPIAGQQMIPRNFGSSSGFFAMNVGVFKTFGIGPTVKNLKGKHRHSGDTKKSFNLTLGIRANNIFNNVNFAPPIGNLSSPLFGKPISTLNSYGFSGQRGNSTNRNINLSLRLSF